MKSLYSWLLNTLLFILLIFVAVQALILIAGTRVAMNVYSESIRDSLAAIAEDVLLDPENINVQGLDYARSLFVFRHDGELMYSNRGRGRAIPEANRTPVYHQGRLIGSWYSSELQFQDSRENMLFLIALSVMAGVSVMLSLGAGSIAAYVTAKRFSGFIGELQADIFQMQEQRKVEKRDFPITEFSQMSANIVRVSTQLYREEEYKRQWMQDLAHDLRTPLAGLRSQLEGMRDGVLAPDPRRIENNLAELKRLENMVEGIRELYNLEVSEKTRSENFSASLLRTALETGFPQLLEKKQIQFDIESTIECYGNYPLLLRALVNIVENASKYRDARFPIVVTMYGNKNNTHIVVQNWTAENIIEDPETYFQRLYRGDQSRNTAGSGLGLNIAREIALRHNGSLKASVTDGKQISFDLTLPSA